MMMEMEDKQVELKPVSMLQGNGLGLSRILTRTSSIGHSSRIFYRAAEGVPFKWEMAPGTPKRPQQEDAIPPLSPPPLIQSLGLPLPNLDDHDESHHGLSLKSPRSWNLKKMMKKSMSHGMIKKIDVLGKRRSKQQEINLGSHVDSDREFGSSSVKDSSVSSISSFPRDSIDGPFCCSPWNASSILDEGNRRIYCCKHHNTTYAEEEDGSFLTGTLSDAADHQFSGHFHNDLTTTAIGIPFRWEMEPGKPKNPPGNDVTPTPSPPAAVQNSAVPRSTRPDQKSVSSMLKRACFWMKGSRKTEKLNGEISFRCRGSGQEEMDAGSGLTISKMKRGFSGSYLSCGLWSNREMLVFGRRKSSN